MSLTRIDPDPTGSLADSRARQGNRRRLLVFIATFLLAMAAGQWWNYSRPAEYRASLRLQLALPDAGGSESAASGAFANRLQLLNSRPVLERLERQAAQPAMAAASGADVVAQLQAMLEVQPLPGSEVLRLVATGADAAALAPLLNAWPEVVRDELATRQRGDADERLTRLQAELGRLDERSRNARARLDRFREQAGVSAERDENEAIAVNKGLAQSLNLAIEKETAAAARLRALTAAAEEGRTNTEVRKDATLTSLEGKAHQVREDLREMERVYTPAFMEMDPRARALRQRLSELERQVEQQRQVGQAAVLQTAREELATAQAQVARLREKQQAVRPTVGKVSSRVAEAKVLEEDLAQIEKARREVLERVARLESNQQRRVATVTVIEPAVTPSSPFRPDRDRDSLWVLGGSTLLALLMMGLVEVFNRPPAPAPAASPAHTTVVLSPGWAGAGPALAGPGGAPAALAGASPLPALPSSAAPAAMSGTAATVAPTAAAPAAITLLDAADVKALLTASRGLSRLACALGLMGLAAHEALALTLGDVDRSGARLQVGGSGARQLPLPTWLLAELPLEAAAAAAAGAVPLLADGAGQPLTSADLQALVAGASLDAGLADGAALGWPTLRHTAIAALLDQGLRYSELPALVGRVEAELLAALASRSTRAPSLGAAEVEVLMAELREPPRG